LHPQMVTLDEATKKTLWEQSIVEPTEIAALRSMLSLPNRHAVDLLNIIPLEDEERRHAVETAHFVIHCDDRHGHTVWGVVCVDEPDVTIRFRHKVSRTLEHVTETLIKKVWDSSGTGKLFAPFGSNHLIPVRESLSTSDAYHGEVLPPGPQLKRRAKLDRRTERYIFWLALFATFVFIGAGYYLYANSDANTDVRWLSSVCDRLATTAMATATLSYLTYFFYLRELQKKPIIDWK